MQLCRWKASFLWILCCSFSGSAETVFTYKSSESGVDVRFQYEYRLLELVLEKTKPQYGQFILKPSPRMNNSRAIKSLEDDKYDNFFMLLPYNKQLSPKLIYIPFPAQRGIVGYRIFITSRNIQKDLEQVNSLEELKTFSIVQGQGWLDVGILRDNGFTVNTLSNYNGLFSFVAKNRSNLLSRAVSEYSAELKEYKGKVPALYLDKKFALHYPFPRFFYTNSNNPLALIRVHQGLDIAWGDGSFIKLWLEYYQDSIEKSELKNRVIYELSNSAIIDTDFSVDIDKYMYQIRE